MKPREIKGSDNIYVSYIRYYWLARQCNMEKGNPVELSNADQWAFLSNAFATSLKCRESSQVCDPNLLHGCSWRNTTRNVALYTLSSNLVCSVSGLKGFTWVEIYKNHYNRLSESIKEVLSHYSSLFLWWTLLHHPKSSAFPALISSTPSKSGMFALSCWRWKCCAGSWVRNKKYGKGDFDGMPK